MDSDFSPEERRVLREVDQFLQDNHDPRAVDPVIRRRVARLGLPPDY